jgi:deoxyribodipyrimidine photolyase
MKIKLSKSQWEEAGKKAGWMKIMNKQAQSTSHDQSGDMINHYVQEKHQLLSAIALAIPCLQDWTERTGFGETYQRDMKALQAMKDVVRELDPEGYVTNAPFEPVGVAGEPK